MSLPIDRRLPEEAASNALLLRLALCRPNIDANCDGIGRWGNGPAGDGHGQGTMVANHNGKEK